MKELYSFALLVYGACNCSLTQYHTNGVIGRLIMTGYRTSERWLVTAKPHEIYSTLDFHTWLNTVCSVCFGWKFLLCCLPEGVRLCCICCFSISLFTWLGILFTLDTDYCIVCLDGYCFVYLVF